MTASIEIENLTVAYDGGAVLRGVSGHLPGSELSAVVGPNGSGKSTLLKAMTGALRPRGGSIRLEGPGKPAFAWLPQQATIDNAFPISVRDLVMLGLWPRIGALAPVTGDQEQAVEAALGAVGLTDFADRRIAALSGGQIQRALFARLIVQDAPAILLDEPFNNIDAHTTQALLRLMEGWRAEGRVVVAVLHDLDLAQRHFGWAMLLAHESVACGPTAEVLTPENLARARHMCDACAADRDFWAAA